MKLRHALASLFRCRRLEAEMAEEMRLHLEARIQENITAGMPPDEARYAARRKFGGMDQTKELAREQRGWVWLEQCWRDFRLAGRRLMRTPGFTVVVVVILALGVGATTTVFTAVNSLLLRSLPVRNPEQLAIVELPMVWFAPGVSEPVSWRLYEAFRDRTTSFSDVFAIDTLGDQLPLVAARGGEAKREHVQVGFVTGNFFEGLGVGAHSGRTLTPEDDDRSAPHTAVVLSHAFWRRYFRADPGIIGETVRIGDLSFTVVGVAQRGFYGVEVGRRVDAWCPLRTKPMMRPGTVDFTEESNNLGHVMVRLRPGVSREQGEAELAVVFGQDLDRRKGGAVSGNERWRNYFLGRKLELISGAAGFNSGDGLRARFRQPLSILMALVVVVLGVACANVAGLLLVRAVERDREFAVSVALGAGRARLLRQLLAESVLLAGMGGMGGLGLAWWGRLFLAGYLPEGRDQLGLDWDGRVLLFSFATIGATAVACGLLTALRSSRLDLMMAMKSQSSAVVGDARQRLSRSLVVVQCALSFVLIASAGLFVRTLQNVQALDDRFTPDNLVMFTLYPEVSYADARASDLCALIIDEVKRLPEVRRATVTTSPPLTGSAWGSHFSVDGYKPAPDEVVVGRLFGVGPAFFETLEIPLIAGRFLTAQDFAKDAPRVAVIDQTMARHFFGATDPVGRRVKWGPDSFLIAGVVGATPLYETLREKAPFIFYMPYVGLVEGTYPMTFVVRVDSSPAALAPSVREIIRRLAPEARLGEFRTMGDWLERTLYRERAIAQFSSFFSLFAVVLAGFGLFGLLSFGVARRTREIGVRMALGARQQDIAALILKQGLGAVLLGCAIGTVGATVVARYVRGFVYGVADAEPVLLVASAVTLWTVALLACVLPVRRAANVDPVIALRAE